MSCRFSKETLPQKLRVIPVLISDLCISMYTLARTHLNLYEHVQMHTRLLDECIKLYLECIAYLSSKEIEVIASFTFLFTFFLCVCVMHVSMYLCLHVCGGVDAHRT